jgi:hypothetical protein
MDILFIIIVATISNIIGFYCGYKAGSSIRKD